MKIDPFIDFINTKVLRSPLSKLFMMLSTISLSLSMINKTPSQLLVAELFIFVSLAITTNCLIYGDCNLSAMLVLLTPIIIIIINISELLGYTKSTETIQKFKKIKQIKEPSFLTKTNKEKQEHIQTILKRNS